MIQHYLRSVVALLSLLLILPASGLSLQASRIQEVTSELAAGASTTQRRAVLTKKLEELGLAYQLQDFVDSGNRKGTNVITTVPASNSQVLLLGAHYDRVAQGQGVVDNGASCAVLLDLLEALKAQPLKTFAVQVVFFDLEEVGLQGSRAFFDARRTSDTPLPAYAINLDIFGYGDAFFAAASKQNGVLAAAMARVAEDAGIPLTLVPPTEYPASDHATMMLAGIETLGIALIDGKEIPAIRDMRQAQTNPPRILTLIHTAMDNLDALRPEDIDRGRAALEKLLRDLDVY